MTTEMVTVVFTDLVRSTELLSRLGPERTEELRREHFALARGVVSDAGGREVKNLGDGLMAVFPAPTAALNAAVTLQQRLELRNRRGLEALEVRIGVSLGEADTEGGDYFGTPVVEAARLCASASGGQVLTTEMVRALVGTRGEHRFESLGPRQLKGLDTPREVCAVDWEPLPAAGAAGIPLPARLERSEGTPFVGRDQEHEVLTDALKDASNPRSCRMVLVSGEPGVGKSTLVAAFAASARDQGATVLYGRCDEDLSVPYGPWRESFAHLDEHLSSALEGRRGALAVLLAGGGTGAGPFDPDSARYVLYAAVVDTLAQASVAAPVVVVLDDLHWADAPSLALVRHLAQSPTPLRVLVVATFREVEIDVAHPLAGLLAALHREQGIGRLPLRGLDDAGLLDLLAALAGHDPGEQGVVLRDALRAETDGNPFFVTEILRHLAETGAIAQGPDDLWIATTDLRHHGLPVSVREVIGLRVGRLGSDTRRALRHAAVIGRDFDLELLAELLGCDDDTAYELLLPATEAAVVSDVEPGRFSFTHALIGHALYDELTPTARARAHHQVAAALERRVGVECGAHSAELARHWALAARPRHRRTAAGHARHAGDYALAQLAPDEAALWYRRAFDLIDPSDPRTRCEVLVDLGEAQRRAGQPAYRSTLLDACRQAISLPAEDLLVRGALANHRGATSEFGAVDEERVGMLRAAIAVRPDGREGALLQGALATELANVDRDSAQQIAEVALALARDADDDRTFATVVAWVMPVVRSPATLTERGSLCSAAEAAAERTGDPALTARLALAAHVTAMEEGDLAAADQRLDLVARHTEVSPDPYTRWLVMMMRSVRQLLAGDLARSEVMAEEALAYGSAAGQGNAFSFYAGQLFELRRAQGRLIEVIDALQQAVADTPGLPAYRIGLAVALCDLGRTDDAASVIEPDLADHFARVPFDLIWTSAMLYAVEVVAALERPGPASVLVELLEPWRDQVAYTGITCGGSVARGLGLALSAAGRREAAVEALEQALRVNQALGAPILAANVELDLARALRPTDPARSRQLATSVTAVGDRLGLLRLGQMARQLLDDLGGP